mmetsp:Transcript_11647/g.19778  ORF Transcript_11647/g.19778 Transcript_11647/m.19778 type:complete len:462 (+) Transcript_11647:1-1386(+)
MSWKAADLFPKLEDYVLQEASVRGALLSTCAFAAMVILAVVETGAYLSSDYRTTVSMDENPNSQLRINFNLTMHDLSCDYATVDLFDTIGVNRQNVTTNVEKWQIDSEGVRRMYQGRNREQKEVAHDDHLHPPIAELHENGVHALEIVTDTWEEMVKERDFYKFTFVDFYAPWCVWCQRLEPTWEKFAEETEAAALPIQIAKVNCVAEPELCKAQRVMAFPTLRFFKGGLPVNAADYRSDRTVEGLLEFAKRKLELETQYRQWPEARKAHATNWNPDHPGCMLVGFLLVNRVPGNFHIEARSKSHNLNAAAANLSHTVNHLSFGNDLTEAQREYIESLNRVSLPAKFAPLDDQSFAVEKEHTAYHHYLKVVSTHYKLGRGWAGKMMAYQILSTNQVMPYQEEDVPEAKFIYDISPMAVVVEKKGRHFYDYLTSLLAILGGTFTVVQLFDNTLYALFKPKAD